jgi:hypothetical protein
MRFHKSVALPEHVEIDDVRRVVASHSSAILIVDGTARSRQFVLDRATGYPVSPADDWMLHGSDHVLCIPDDSPGCVQLMVQAEPLNTRTHPSFDRFLATHGAAQGLKFVRWNVETVKTGHEVFDGTDLAGNGFAITAEAPALRLLNANPVALASAVQKVLEKVWAEPRAVGVDHWGVDLASRFGPTRVNFETRVAEDELEAAVKDLLAI